MRCATLRLELPVYSLPPATDRLWALLQHAGELDGFVLIGGTALSLQLNHRISEDLDFIQAKLFRLKCIAAADRSKSRDWLDLYLLLQSGRFTHRDFIEAYERAGVPQKRDIALARMTGGKLAATDEGFSTLLGNPPSLEVMREFFVALADAVEQELAARVFAGGKPGE